MTNPQSFDPKGLTYEQMYELVEAMKSLAETQQERDEAFASCDHSWGYFGHAIEEQLAAERQAFGKTLTAIIDARVVAALSSLHSQAERAKT